MDRDLIVYNSVVPGRDRLPDANNLARKRQPDYGQNGPGFSREIVAQIAPVQLCQPLPVQACDKYVRFLSW